MVSSEQIQDKPQTLQYQEDSVQNCPQPQQPLPTGENEFVTTNPDPEIRSLKIGIAIGHLHATTLGYPVQLNAA